MSCINDNMALALSLCCVYLGVDKVAVTLRGICDEVGRGEVMLIRSRSTSACDRVELGHLFVCVWCSEAGIRWQLDLFAHGEIEWHKVGQGRATYYETPPPFPHQGLHGGCQVAQDVL